MYTAVKVSTLNGSNDVVIVNIFKNHSTNTMLLTEQQCKICTSANSNQSCFTKNQHHLSSPEAYSSPKCIAKRLVAGLHQDPLEEHRTTLPIQTPALVRQKG